MNLTIPATMNPIKSVVFFTFLFFTMSLALGAQATGSSTIQKIQFATDQSLVDLIKELRVTENYQYGDELRERFDSTNSVQVRLAALQYFRDATYSAAQSSVKPIVEAHQQYPYQLVQAAMSYLRSQIDVLEESILVLLYVRSLEFLRTENLKFATIGLEIIADYFSKFPDRSFTDPITEEILSASDFVTALRAIHDQINSSVLKEELLEALSVLDAARDNPEYYEFIAQQAIDTRVAKQSRLIALRSLKLYPSDLLTELGMSDILETLVDSFRTDPNPDIRIFLYEELDGFSITQENHKNYALGGLRDDNKDVRLAGLGYVKESMQQNSSVDTDWMLEVLQYMIEFDEEQQVRAKAITTLAAFDPLRVRDLVFSKLTMAKVASTETMALVQISLDSLFEYGGKQEILKLLEREFSKLNSSLFVETAKLFLESPAVSDPDILERISRKQDPEVLANAITIIVKTRNLGYSDYLQALSDDILKPQNIRKQAADALKKLKE